LAGSVQVGIDGDMTSEGKRSRLQTRSGCTGAGGTRTMTVRVLIADDHGVVCEGVRVYLEMDDDLEVVGEAQNGQEAIDLTRQTRPDVVLMDLVMPLVDGISATESIRRELPDTEVLTLSGYLEDHLIVESLRAGAIGYVLKDTGAQELRRAVCGAAAGQVQLSPAVAARLVRRGGAPDGLEELTKREVDVLILLARGRSNKQIARELHVGEQTVKTHVSNILAKLNLSSRTEAALVALRAGLIAVEIPAP
jgi:two-component system, NarL family, response regulator LiaR